MRWVIDETVGDEAARRLDAADAIAGVGVD